MKFKNLREINFFIIIININIQINLCIIQLISLTLKLTVIKIFNNTKQIKTHNY